MDASLVLIAGLGGAAHVEMLGLDGGLSVCDLDDTISIASVESDVTQALFGLRLGQ